MRFREVLEWRVYNDFVDINGWRDGWFLVGYDVIFRDLDPFGHVNNAVYLTYFELARTQLWFAITGGSVPHDISFIVARAECDFRAQVGMELIEIRVRIAEIRTTSFDFVYEIAKRRDSQIAATGRVIVVLYDWERNTKIAIDASLRQRIRDFQGESLT